MKYAKWRVIVTYSMALFAILIILIIPTKLGEMKNLANRMLQEKDVRDLLRKTQNDLAALGRNLPPLSMNINTPKVGDVYRGSTGRILLVDRLSQFGFWIDPRVKDGNIIWECSTAFTTLKIYFDCDVTSLDS